MGRKGLGKVYARELVQFMEHVVEEKPLLPFLIPLLLFAWLVERWVVPFSNWVPLGVAVWVIVQHGRYQRKQLVEDLNHKWKQFMLQTSTETPVEPVQWLNKLLVDVWPNYLEPKITKKLSHIVEKRVKHRKPKWIERIQLLEFSLGSCPPSLGLQGTHWYTSGNQRVLAMGFDWFTHEMSIMLSAKLAKPLRGTARIVINEIQIKGKLLLMPSLGGRAMLFSFESTPEVKVGVAFGGNGNPSLPATELPGVPSWLVKLFTDTLNKTMVEPRRGCFSLPVEDYKKRAIGGLISVTVVSAKNLVGRSMSNISGSRQNQGGYNQLTDSLGHEDLLTFVEVEIEEFSRKTLVGKGRDPVWDDTFNLFLHGDNGILKFNLCQQTLNGVKYDHLTSCEIKMKYVPDDSTIFWAIGPESGIVVKQSSHGKEVQMVVPFEGNDLGELAVSLMLKEWQFSDDLNSSTSSINERSQQSIHGSPIFQSRTGRKIKINVVEGKNLTAKAGKLDLYVRLEYGKVLCKTQTISHNSNPIWDQSFEFDEIGNGEYLKLKCYNTDFFGDENIGNARVIIDGIPEGSPRDVWIPLEKASRGELRLQLEAMKNEDPENSQWRSGYGLIELVLIEARDLIAADLRGTSDPYVRVRYGNLKKSTKVVYKTLHPQWNQTLEFRDTGSPLVLHVKDHNALLPTSSIGNCEVEYETLPPNQIIDKWIPLQGVKSGEIHIQITRKFPELEKKSSLDANISGFSKANKMSGKMREQLKKIQAFVDDGDLENLSLFLSEVESTEDMQEEYMLQLETEKSLLLSKTSDLGREISKASTSTIRKAFSS